MSGLSHTLAAEPSIRGIAGDGGDPANGGDGGGNDGTADNGHGLIHAASETVQGVVPGAFGVDKADHGSLNIESTNGPGDSLAIGLNLGLVQDGLSKNTNTVANAATHASGASTTTNSNNNTTIPTPITMSNNNSTSVENSNPGTNKSTGMSGIRSSMHSVASSNSSPIMSNELSTNTMRMFQRMDEISARLIAMEEMFQKLCKSVDQQNLAIADLKLENAHMSKELSHKIDLVSVQNEQNSDRSLQESFAADLLNSITNVSSAYLSRMRSQTGNKKPQSVFSPTTTALNEMANNLPNNNKLNHNDELNAGPHSFRNFGTFTLNPNGIKRRRKNDVSSDNLTNSGLNTNVTSGTQSYKDLTSLNAFGTINLPNLTLDSTGMTPLLKNGANGMSFPRLQDNSNTAIQQQDQLPLQPHHNHDGHPDNSLKDPNAGIVPREGNEVSGAQEDDDDGYQEDDDDDNDSDGSEDEDDEDEDEDEDEIDDDEEANSNGDAKLKNGNFEEKRGNLKNIRKRPREDWKNSSFPNRDIPDKVEGVILKNSTNEITNHGAKNEKVNSQQKDNGNNARGMNYTLLKAPSNVRTIWEEYTVGIGGNPPIKKLNERYGSKWRLNRNRKTYARRKRLYKFILNGISDGKTAEEMIDILEERRLYKDENGEVKRRTIGWLQQSLTGI